MTRDLLRVDVALLVDHITLLVELDAIGAAIAVLEQQFGFHAEFEDARRRQQRVCVTVFEQLHGLLALMDADHRTTTRLPKSQRETLVVH